MKQSRQGDPEPAVREPSHGEISAGRIAQAEHRTATYGVDPTPTLATNWGDSIAYAVVMQVTLPEGAGPDQAQQMLDDIVVPQAKSQPGFTGGTWMHDGPKGMGIIMFESAETAEAAMEALKPPPGGPQLVSTSVFEVRAQA